MRIAITHETRYVYDAPVRSSTQYLRLVPRDTARQKVLEWKLDTPAATVRTRDGYGNVLDVLTLDKPVSEIRIVASGVVETSTAVDEPADFPVQTLSPLLFLRATGLTRYIALCLLAGYAWLALSGVLLAMGASFDNGRALWDAALHSILLGFVFSMVFGHAPVILPAVLRVALPSLPECYICLPGDRRVQPGCFRAR